MSWLNMLRLGAALPTLALASWLGTAPGLAAAQITAAQTATQAVPPASEPVLVANLGNILRDINRGAQDMQRELQRQQQRQEREAARQGAAERQRLETERQRLEAERQRLYFESLTPEQQQAYIAERRARQAAQAQVMTELFILLIGSGDDAGNSSNSNSMDDCLRLGIRSQACGTD